MSALRPITPELMRRAGAMSGCERATDLALAWTTSERRRRADGEAARPWAMHAARTVLLRLASPETASMALAVIYAGMWDRDPSAWGRPQMATEARAASDLKFARHIMDLTLAGLEARRDVLAMQMRRTVQRMMDGLEPSSRILAELHAMDTEDLFLPPDLRALLSDEIATFARRQRFEARRRVG